MEALKTWLVLLTALAAAFFGATAYQQAARIEELKAQLVQAKGPGESVQTSALPADTAAAGKELLAMRQDRDRYRAGLERCVGELNRSQDAGAPAAMIETYIVGISASQHGGQADIVVLGELSALPSGDSVIVQGKLYNRGTAHGSGVVQIDLFNDGRRRYSERLRVDAAAGQVVVLDHVFPHLSPEGLWTAQARVSGVVTDR